MNPFNQKKFLAPDSINSMAAVQTKIHEDGRAILRISDCYNSIKIWNNIKDQKERDEMIEKLSRLQTSIEQFKDAILTIDYNEINLTDHQKQLMENLNIPGQIVFESKEIKNK